MSDPTPTPPVVDPAPSAPPVVPDGATPPGTYPEGLGDPGKRALDAERARADQAERDLKALRDKADADAKAAEDAKLSELERAQQTANEARAAADKQLEENQRLRFAFENGVPAAWVNRLQGSTPEELAADWAILQPTLAVQVDPNAPRVPAPVPNPGPQPGPPQTEDDLLYEEIYGSTPK